MSMSSKQQGRALGASRGTRHWRPAAVAAACASAACVVGLLASATPADAAVRTCQPPRASGVVTGVTESEGKRRAIEAWMEKVKPLGPRYMGWGTATQRMLKCVRGKGGLFECVAVATPCTIEQAPGRPGQPPGRPPLGRKRPGDPGRPIEI